MYWKIDEKVFMAPLSLITFLEDDVYSPTAIEEDQKFIEDIKTNEQTTNIFLTEDNVCIGGRRICKALKTIAATHARAQRVKVEPKYRSLFLFSTNHTRKKTPTECCREIEVIDKTIPRHQGKKDPEAPKPQSTTATLLPVPPQTEVSLTTPETTKSTAPKTLSPIAAPPHAIAPAPTNQPRKDKPKVPIQQAVELADNGVSKSNYEKYQFIKRIEEKYGTKLLHLLDSTGNYDKVYKAAQTAKERNEKKDNPTPPLEIPTTARHYPHLQNKSNWQMNEVENNSIDFCFTSNPYLWQIDYNDANKNQMGQEPTIEEFIENLVHKSYKEVYRKMAPTGNLLVNMKGTVKNGVNQMVEEHFKIAMGKAGWLYQDTFIWLKKGGGKRSGNRRRPENSYESIFWFTKSSDYYYNPIEIPNDKPITVTHKAAETRIESKGLTVSEKYDVSLPFTSFKNVIDETKFLDVVITNSAATDSQFMNELYGRHPAPFPMALPLLFLLQFCPPNGRVLEPFLGRGAGLVSPLMLGHTCYGYEIEAEYFIQAQKLLADVVKDIDYYRERMKEIELQYQQKFNIAA